MLKEIVDFIGGEYMTRDEIIDLLIEDRINEWIHAAMHEGLKEALYVGWKGFDDYTDQELYDEFEELVEENFDDVKAEKIRVEKDRINLYNKN